MQRTFVSLLFKRGLVPHLFAPFRGKAPSILGNFAEVVPAASDTIKPRRVGRLLAQSIEKRGILVFMVYVFDIDIAAEFGVNEAIMMQNFAYWIGKNAANDKNFHDGRYWTYNSVEAFAKLFPFWNAAQVRHILKNLIDKGVLIKGNYNAVGRDRTCWYAFTDAICQKYYSHLIKLTNGFDNFDKCSNSEEESNINTNINADNNINNKKTKKDINLSLFGNKGEGIIEESVRGGREGDKGSSKMEPQKQTRKKAETVENLCLFADSKFNDFNKFLEQFKGPDFERLDMWHYYSVVSDWSASNGAKKRDWIATTRNWIRSDKERGKLHLNQQAGVALDPSAIKYLQEMGDGLF